MIQKRVFLKDQTRLSGQIDRSCTGLKDAGFDLGGPCSPVVAVKMPDSDTTVRFWEHLLNRGIYVNLAMPPATPQGLCLLRCSLSAAHTPEQIDTIVEAFKTVSQLNSVYTAKPAA